MAVALLTTYIHVLLLVLTLQQSTSRTPDCGAPMTVTNEDVDLRKTFLEANLRYVRYICQKGYKREAGTSNLAICVFDNTTNKTYWKYANISCIQDTSLPVTTHSTLMSSTTSDQHHHTTFPTLAISATKIMDTTRPTTSGSSSSRDFTSSFTELERFTTPLPTATVKILNTQQTSKTKLGQQTQVPGQVSTTKITTTGYHPTTEGQTTHSAESQSTTILPTTVGQATVRTMTQRSTPENAATPMKTTQSVPESTYTSTDETLNLSTISYYTTTGHDSNIPDTSLWQQGRTAGSIAGVLLPLTLILGIIIWIKRRKQHSPVPQEESNPEHNYSVNQEEQEEESSNL